MNGPLRMSLNEALTLIAEDPDQARYAFPVHHGTMRVGVYAPRGTDHQKPHGQDELYIVISGTGRFYLDGSESHFNPGDVLFVGAGSEHRFENFTDDFAAWVVFWGPDGGESDSLRSAEATA